MTQTAIITGATGLLGRQVLKAFQRANWNAIGTGFTRAQSPIEKLDLNNPAEISQLLDSAKPQVIVHCAANRFPDKCDSDPAGTRALNIEASATLARLCAERDIVLVYISTDYVFPGTEGHAPYQVDDAPKPPNLYGETKWEGEKAVLKEFEKAGKSGGVVLRVPVLYGEGENRESAVGVLMNVVVEGREGVKMDHWALRYPTNTEDVGRVCKDIATKYLSSDQSALPKILQFSSEDKYTKYEICQLFAEIMGSSLDGMIANTEGNDPKASVQRPYDCHLSSKALQDLGIDTSTMDFAAWWRWQVKAFRK